MTRPGSQHPHAGREEEKIVSRIDRMREWFNMLTEDEVLAFKIAFGVQKPDDNHSREWAEKKIRTATRCRTVGRMAALAFEGSDSEYMAVAHYFVPAAPQKIEAEVNSTNLNLNRSIDELSDSELEALCAKKFGKAPMIED